MKICVVGSSKLFFSGITTHTIFLANALAKRNQVTVIPLRKLLPKFLFPGREHVGKNQYSVDFDPQIDLYKGMDYNSPLTWLGAYRFMKEHQPDAIIMLWWSSSVAHMQMFLKLANRCGIGAKMVLEMHEVVDPLEESILPIRFYSRFMGRRLVRGLDAYTTQSQFDKELVAKVYNIKEDMTFVVPVGIYEDYKQPLDMGLCRKQLGINEEFVILYFGLIRQYKGVSCLIKAFNAFPESVASRCRLLIVGEIWEDESILRKLIEDSKYRSQISLISRYVPDEMIPVYFSVTDVVALPYLRASGSGVAHIALAYGKPLVVSDVEALRESLEDYKGASFAPPGDDIALGDKLLQATRDIESNGRVHYPPPQRSWDNIATQYETILARIISKR